jgi:nucleotide-binding universal stress UspA family protein
MLVPVDFTAASREALLFALQMAACTARSINVLHVVHESMNRAGTYPRLTGTDQILPLEEIAGKMLRDFMAGMREQHPDNAVLANAGVLIVSGLPATRIPEIAQRTDACLIVMGSNGRSSLARLVAGSVSEKVIRHSPVPVTIVHANGTVREHNRPPERDYGNMETQPEDSAKLYLVSGKAG